MSPFGASFNSENGYVYVANFYSNSISIIDGFTNNLVMTIPLDSNTFPAGVMSSSENGYIYVTNFYSTSTTGTNLSAGTVSVINGSTNTVVDTIQVGISPLGIAINPENGNLYVTNFYSGSISVINGSTNSVVDTVPSEAQGPLGIAFNPENGNLYVTNFYSGSISVINGSTNSVVDTINDRSVHY
jgi:YVTN family beta-propeller protein